MTLNTRTTRSGLYGADAPTFALAGASMVVLGIGLSGAIPWVLGRMNSDHGMLCGVALLLCFPLWFVLTGTLVAWIIIRMKAERGRWRIVRWCALLPAFLPWFVHMTMSHDGLSLLDGFSRWADVNIEADAIRQWRNSLSSKPGATAAPYWWPTQEVEAPVGEPIAESAWPPEITRVHRDEVRLLSEGSVILGWKGGFDSWSRFVIIEPPDCPAFDEFRSDSTIWDSPRVGLRVAISDPY